MSKSDHSGHSVRKSAISTTIAVILTAIIVGSVVGGAASYLFMTRSDSTIQEVRSDLKSVADAMAVPIDKPDEMKKLMEERKVIEAAKQEGKVVVDTFALTEGTPELRSAFERRYPFITVEIRQAAATEVIKRFLSEYEKGTKAADVITLGAAGLFDILQKPDSLAKYVPKDSGYLASDLKDKEGRWASHTSGLFGIGYNTKLVPKAEAPKSYMDLLDPKWTGKIGTADPKSAPVIASIWKAMEKQLGEDFMKKLAAQKIKYYATGLETLNKFIAGEFSIYLNAVVASTENSKLAGNPVDWVRTSDNAYLAQFGWYGISANAPHPNAARLWLDFVFSKEGQQTLANTGQIANMPGIRLSNPDIALQGKKLIQLESVADAERTAFLNAFSAKYGLSFP